MTRLRLIARGGLIAGTVAVAYAAAWFIVGSVLKSGIETWVADRRADGWTIDHGPIVLDGFPLSWKAAVATPRLGLIKPDGRYQWSGPAISLGWKPWSPRTVHYSTTGTHLFDLAAKAPADLPQASLEMAAGKGSLVFGPQGRLREFAVLIDGGRLTLQGGSPVRFNRLEGVVESNPPANGIEPERLHLTPSVRLDTELFGLTFPSDQQLPLGRTIGRFALQGTVLGQIQPGRPAEALSIWQKDGGTIEVGRLDIGWGPLSVKTAGTLALDPNLQPIAALTGRFTGYIKTLEALVTARLIKPRAALIGKFALASLARPSTDGGPPEIKVPVSLQDRLLSIGPLKLLQIPKVRWN